MSLTVSSQGSTNKILRPDGYFDIIEQNEKGGSPFTLYRCELRNESATNREVRCIEFHRQVPLSFPVREYRTLGVDGLKSAEGPASSYLFLGVGRPDGSQGTIAGWITQERGSGSVHCETNGQGLRITGRLEFGRMLIRPGESVITDAFAIGEFADARQGLEAYADLIASVNQIKLPKIPSGYCTWYSEPHGGASDEKSLADLGAFCAKELVKFGFDTVLVDDQWQGPAVPKGGIMGTGPTGNFTRHDPRGPYPSGMKANAELLTRNGLRPGLWFTPFSWDPRDPLFNEHQDWFVKKQNGSLYEVLWAGWCLDMTHPDARAFLSNSVQRITGEWKYRYLKPDAMWCGLAAKCTYPGTAYVDDQFGDAVFKDPGMTGIDAYRAGMRTMRQAAGSGTYIAACNVAQNFRSMGGAIGLVDAMRIGPDTGTDWDAIMPNFNLGTRLYFLHNRVWHNDPDCLMVRAPLTLTQARSFASWIALSGYLNLVSEWLPGLPAERLDCIKRSMPNTGLAARPVDVFENMPARTWHLTDGRRHVVGLFNWDAKQPATTKVKLDQLGLADSGATFVGLDYWSGNLVPIRDGKVSAELPPCGCSVISIARTLDRPQVLGTSRHITQCFVDLNAEQWEDHSLSGSCKLVGGDATELRIATTSTRGAWKAIAAEASREDRMAGVTVAIKSEPGLLRVTLTAPGNREVKWRVQFDPKPEPAALSRASDDPKEHYVDLRDATHAACSWGMAHNNASVEGKPLRIGGSEFAQGIGTHAPAKLVFPLDAKWSWFSFYCGVSADMTEKGSVTVQAWLDGEKVFDSGIMRVHEEPRYVSLPVSGGKELRIVGTDAGDGIAADHLNLCNLRLSASAEAPKPDAGTPLVFVGEAPAPDSPLTLWYRQPAKRWLEALPVGNGRVGAMVFGGVGMERLALNESTFWSGAPDLTHDNPEAREHLQEIRQLLFAGQFRKAQDLISRHLLGRRGNYGTHLPVGDLLLRWRHADGEVREYRRELDLDQAAASSSYTIAGVRFKQEVIASHPDNVIAVRLSADQPGKLSFQLGFKANREPSQVKTRGNDTLVITADAREAMHSDGQTGVSLAGLVRVVPEGGKVMAQGDTLEIANANAVTLLIVLNTTFNGGQPAGLCEQQLAAALTRDFAALRQRQVADYQDHFRRVSLDLGSSAAARFPTDQRLARLRRGEDDPALIADFFQFGRYLLIAGSRGDSPLPTNLQGIWNDNLACTMGWTCDFHLDINTQQNYWPAEVCNLSECHEPLFRLIESLRVPGRRTAQTVYGARGWVCHVFTDAWVHTAPGWGLGWGMHPTGGIWIGSHLWERYQFTGDRGFLRQHAYPTLKEAAEFFLDYMVEDPKHGWLVTGPSSSPENAFVTPNGQGTCSEYMGPTCDIVLVRDLFNSCIEAGQILEVDPDFRARLEVALKKLPPLRVGKHGQLMEWLEDFEEAIPNHRHTSHLIALYPSNQITPRGTPELARAARVTLQRRLGRPDWEDVEWSRANLINFYARLEDGEEAYKHVLGLLCENTDADLLTFSRGGIAGATENIFCIDGNEAGTAGIAEMLLQSHVPGQIALLPALPKAWSRGSVKGLKARGNLTVDIEWEDGKVTSYRLRSATPKLLKLQLNQETRSVTPEKS